MRAPDFSARATASTRAARRPSFGPDFLSWLSVVIASEASSLRSSRSASSSAVDADDLGLLVAGHRGEDPGVGDQHLGPQAGVLGGDQGDGLLRDTDPVLVGLDQDQAVGAGRQHPGPDGAGRRPRGAGRAAP